MTKAEQTRLTAWRLRVLQQAADDGNVARVCRWFGISRKSFYKWKRRRALARATCVMARLVAIRATNVRIDDSPRKAGNASQTAIKTSCHQVLQHGRLRLVARGDALDHGVVVAYDLLEYLFRCHRNWRRRIRSR
jgi:hypothetical protein